MKFYQSKAHQEQVGQLNEQREKIVDQQFQKSHKKKLGVIIGISMLILVLAGAGVGTYFHYVAAGPFDTFAKCLTERGAVMYGAIEWCKYTQGQAKMFGKSFKYVNYHDASELAGLKTRPTWIIDGKWYEKVQSFEKLAEVTGCKLG